MLILLYVKLPIGFLIRNLALFATAIKASQYFNQHACIFKTIKGSAPLKVLNSFKYYKPLFPRGILNGGINEANKACLIDRLRTAL